MAGQHFSERELALLCLASVIPSEVENGAAGKPPDRWEGGGLSEREASESNLSILPVERASFKQLELSRLRST
jgi:hypothetical protein